MKRKPHVSKEDRKFPLLFAKGNHWEIPILTDESDIFNKQKHLLFAWESNMFHGKTSMRGKNGKVKIKLKKHGVQHEIDMFDGNFSVASGTSPIFF